MSERGIRVTAEDLETGEGSERVIEPGNYCLVVASPCYVASEQHHANGTTTLILKGRDRSRMATVQVPTTGGSDG